MRGNTKKERFYLTRTQSFSRKTKTVNITNCVPQCEQLVKRGRDWHSIKRVSSDTRVGSEILREFIKTRVSVGFPLHSRVHRFASFDGENAECFVKRDDEIGSMQMGSKMRKYASLIPYILEKGYEEVAVIGSLQSNNVLGLSQMLRQNRVKFRLFLLKPSREELIGNALLTSLICDKSEIEWVDRKDWVDVERLCNESYKSKKEGTEVGGRRVYIAKEGALNEEALPGALTLSLDIAENERELGKEFKHVFLDVGTGLTAIAACLGFGWMRRHQSLSLHLVHMSDTAEDFEKKLESFRVWLENQTGSETIVPASRFHHYPSKHRSFGSTGPEIFDLIHHVARDEGVLLDPIYSAKLFATAKEVIKNSAFEGPTLIVHAGGCYSLSGFQRQLQDKIKAS